MKKKVSILLILFSFALLSAQNDEQYQYKHCRPTSKGIYYYVKTNIENFIKEYQAYIEDTLYNYNIGTAILEHIKIILIIILWNLVSFQYLMKLKSIIRKDIVITI